MLPDISTSYFKMSFRFDKQSPKDFGLVPSLIEPDIYVDVSDNSRWIKQSLYDFGWGNENGYVRLPMLTFTQLWYLVTNSPIQENQYGGAHIVDTNYPDELLFLLLEMPAEMWDTGIITACRVLKLHEAINRSSTSGKSLREIARDYERWQQLSVKVQKLSGPYL